MVAWIFVDWITPILKPRTLVAVVHYVSSLTEVLQMLIIYLHN